MTYMRKRKMARLPEGAESPLEAAIEGRDKSVLDVATAAVQHRQTMLAYQPVMQTQPPHQAAFFEGLVRVLDETGRIIPARDFMPMVENTEIGRELDVSALDLGLRTLARNPNVRLSINMSARSIGYKAWNRTLDRHLKNDGTLGERLMLEINEASAMAVPELVIDFMDRLQRFGIAFALDDFGAGETAFRHFRDFFFDAVKIDGQFVRGLHRNPDNQSVTRALIALAKEFDMLIIASSVEDIKDAEMLSLMGVDCLQGYLFGAPTLRPPWIPDKAAQSA